MIWNLENNHASNQEVKYITVYIEKFPLELGRVASSLMRCGTQFFFRVTWFKTDKGETDYQPRLDAWDKCSGLVHWEDPDRWDREGGGRGGSRWGTHVNPWLIHVNVWQKPLQYCKVTSLQPIKKGEKKKDWQPKWIGQYCQLIR